MHATERPVTLSSTAICLLDGLYRCHYRPDKSSSPAATRALLLRRSGSRPLASPSPERISLQTLLALGSSETPLCFLGGLPTPAGSTDRYNCHHHCTLASCPKSAGEGIIVLWLAIAVNRSAGWARGERACGPKHFTPAPVRAKTLPRTDYGGEHCAGSLDAVSF